MMKKLSSEVSLNLVEANKYVSLSFQSFDSVVKEFLSYSLINYGSH